MRINRAYVKRLEDLIMQLDATLSDLDAQRATGELERDMPLLRQEADRIRDSRNAHGTVKRGQKSKGNSCSNE